MRRCRCEHTQTIHNTYRGKEDPDKCHKGARHSNGVTPRLITSWADGSVANLSKQKRASNESLPFLAYKKHCCRHACLTVVNVAHAMQIRKEQHISQSSFLMQKKRYSNTQGGIYSSYIIQRRTHTAPTCLGPRSPRDRGCNALRSQRRLHPAPPPI